MTFIDREQLPVAEQTVVVRDEQLGIDRKVIAGKRIPPDLIGAYRKATGVQVADPAPASGPSGVDYESMPVEDLQAEADRRDLEVEGTGSGGNVLKKDLVDALKADDEQ